MTAGGEIKESVQCRGRTKNGIRCRRYTTMYPKFCGGHTEDFKLKKSTLHRAGKGLFVKRDFANNEKIGEYKGQKMTRTAFENQVPESAFGYRFKNHILDAKKTQSCIGRNINDARDPARNNVEFVDRLRQNKVDILTTKPVKSGSELFLDYGPNYWGAVDDAKGAKRAKGGRGAKGAAKGLAAIKRGPAVKGVRLKGGAFRGAGVKGVVHRAAKSGPAVKGVRLKGGAFRPVKAVRLKGWAAKSAAPVYRAFKTGPRA